MEDGTADGPSPARLRTSPRHPTIASAPHRRPPQAERVSTEGAAASRRSWRERFGSDLQSDWVYVRRLLIALALIGFAYFLWKIAGVLLLIFAAVLLAVLLSSFAELIARHTPIPSRFSLLLGLHH